MGLDLQAVRLLLKMHDDGVRLGKTLTLGRQHNHLTRGQYRSLCAALGVRGSQEPPRFADDILSMMGSTSIDAIDISDYEGASLIQDLNSLVPRSLRQTYDLVFDGGTLEHIFHFPTALRSCLEMLKPGGRFVSVTMANNYCGHGFYQFSPELFWRALSDASGFKVEEMYVAVKGGSCFRVEDPDVAKRRVELCNNRPVSLMVHARKLENVDIFVRTPQQSDYERIWANHAARSKATAPSSRPGWFEWPLVKKLREWRANWIMARNRQRLAKSNTLRNRSCYTLVDFRL
jgi:hypothetical protein